MARARALGVVSFLALLSALPLSARAQPAACLNTDPSTWPPASKPYVMLIADTSNQVWTDVGPNACGYEQSRNGHMRCALSSVVPSFAGRVNFGLATWRVNGTSCTTCTSSCTYGTYAGDSAGSCGNGSGETREGAYIRVPLAQDAVWSTPQPSNAAQLLQWFDNDCTGGTEILRFGTPSINGALRDMARYFGSSWTAPGGGPTYTTPLAADDLAGTGVNGASACRSVNVVLLMAGDEGCGDSAFTVPAATALYQDGVTVGGKTFKIRVHVLNIGGASTADSIAAAGGTGSAITATTAPQMIAGLNTILGRIVPSEVCDNVDNDCNGCTDEGSVHYCNVPPVFGSCCAWNTPAQRTSCMSNYYGSITAAQPQGNRALLPCANAAQVADPTAWLCVNPGDTCDNADNNCAGGTDENTLRCGSPLHCPSTELCDGQDNDCDGMVDELVCPPGCVVSAETCDGCDNDCDGQVDEGVASTACGTPSPMNCAGMAACVPQTMVPPGACHPGGGIRVCNNNPQPETCDNVDNNCNGVVDDNGPTVPCVPVGTSPSLDLSSPISQCRRGQQGCDNVCRGFIGPSNEICDGIDNDCDGSVDENAVGVGQACSTGTTCASGTVACVNGLLVCQGGQNPQQEVCDGLDNDCDGQVDEGALADAPPIGMEGCWNIPGNCCVVGMKTWCPPATATCGDTGPLSNNCAAGRLACSGAGGWICQGDRPPTTETCNGLDDDCDGTADDNLGAIIGIPCGTAEGACTQGVSACTNGQLVCDGAAPTVETCNGVDDDCNGTPDDGLASSGTCMSTYDTTTFPGERTMGLCRAGVLACISGADGCAGAVAPVQELCNGLDDDCDGQVDESGSGADGIDGTASVTDPSRVLGMGCQTDPQATACAPGTYVCAAGAVVCDMTAPRFERCDGLDNDCDGTVDEADVGAPALCLPTKSCVETSAAEVLCALPCEGGCPSGQRCEDVVSSETGAALAQHCVAYDDTPVTPDGGVPDSGTTEDAGADAGVTPPSSSGCGCRVDARGDGSTSGILAALFVLALALRRRAGSRRARAVAIALSLTALTAACGGSNSPRDGSTDAVVDTGVDASECVPTVEVCNGVDDDCNGTADDVDPTDVQSCGGCGTNCLLDVDNCVVGQIACNAGACICGACAPGFFDVDQDGATCEVQNECAPTAATDTTCNGVDEDCDGNADDDADLCSTASCGGCGVACALPHATARCGDAAGGACAPATAKCQVDACECTGAGNCYFDADHAPQNGCELQCDVTNNGVEICDGLDNDCDGLVDALDDLTGDATIGVTCQGGLLGRCGEAETAGTTMCANGAVVCAGVDVVRPYELPETCNGEDDDCDGTVDESPEGVGAPCGQSNVLPCRYGTAQCVNGSLTCQGARNPAQETCNGVDDNCDGVIDLTGSQPPADAVGACSVPTPPPSGATSPCTAGALACANGRVICNGAVGPSSPLDTCGVDANCDGILTNQPAFESDVHNCNGCGIDCMAGSQHARFACMTSTCVFTGCEAGYYDLNGDQRCEYACTFTSQTEMCNGMDDNCNGFVDENPYLPPTSAVCGVSPNATTPECTTGVTVSCSNGALSCTFPSRVCASGCSNDDEVCDGLDNDCDGLVNENVPLFGQACASDAGQPLSHGPCRTTGAYICNGESAVQCSAMKADCNTLPGGCTEQCDGVDNDCDGLTDEPFTNRGSNMANFVRPTVTQTGASSWVMTYEASRTSATASSQGTGNGYHTSAPIGATLDRTLACSVPNRLPWTNVSPQEAEQTCIAQGGFLCGTMAWTTACRSRTGMCTYGYGASCMSDYQPGTQVCNVGPSFDTSPSSGDQDALVTTANPALLACFADWADGQTNNRIYDIAGNAREITFNAAGDYRLMGGSYASDVTTSAACSANSLAVDASYRSPETGFRCCFSSNPSP